MKLNKDRLDEVYDTYNKRKFVSPDPLQFLYDYDGAEDREIVGLIASSLAYGRVQQILKSIACVLEPMGVSPHSFVCNGSLSAFENAFGGFKHRFTTGGDIALMLEGVREAIVSCGSIEAAFMEGYSDDDETLLPAMGAFVKRIASKFEDGKTYLLPHPEKGSACKRFNLYLRWLVRCDDVDPGGWDHVPSSKLLIPLDTHMANICKSAGITKRKSADLKAVEEVTRWFRKINQDDPVKYDFALTRFGIRDEMTIEQLFNG